MNEAEVRLEALKLAHTHGAQAPAVLERAKAYEDYLNGSTGAKAGTLTLPGKKGPTTPKGAG